MKKFLTLGFAAVDGDGARYRLPEERGGCSRGRARSGSPGGRRGDRHGGDDGDDRRPRRPRPRRRPRPPRPRRPRPPSRPSRSTFERPPHGGLFFLRQAGLASPLAAKLVRSAAGLGGSPPPPRGRSRAGVRASRLRRRARSLARAAPGPRARGRTSSASPRTRSRSSSTRTGRPPRSSRSRASTSTASTQSQRIDEVWTLPPTSGAQARLPRRDAIHHLWASASTRSAVLQLRRHRDGPLVRAVRAAARRPRRRSSLHLPLYSGDTLVAYLLARARPSRSTRRARREIRALLAPLTASLHASRNWEIAVTDELSGLSSRRYFETRFAEEWARHRRYGAPADGGALRPRPLQAASTTRSATAPETWRSAGSARSSAPPCARATSPAAYGGEEFAVLFPETRLAAGPRRRRPRPPRARARALRASDGRPFRVTVSAGRGRHATGSLRGPSAASCSSGPTRRSTTPRTRAATARGSVDRPPARRRARARSP